MSTTAPAGLPSVAVVGPAPSAEVGSLARGLVAELRRRGEAAVDVDPGSAGLVFNLASVEDPRHHWRRSGLGQFGVTLLSTPADSLARAAEAPAEVLSLAYPALLKTMSNALIACDGERLVLVTPELGVRPLGPAGDAGAVLEAVLPLAGARFCIDNLVREDLAAELEASPAVRALREGGSRLAGLGLLPSPVALEELLGESDLKLLRAIYGVQQISYGNLSCREPTGGFWMSGRGVDKSRLERVGRDLLLITGHDRTSGLIGASVPAGSGEARASVDAMEHALIYERWPEVGAIVHVHAWMAGVDSTRQSWPCGTVEIAEEVAALLARQAEPARAVVGLRNHGLTITGADLGSIFDRIEGRLLREVPPT